MNTEIIEAIRQSLTQLNRNPGTLDPEMMLLDELNLDSIEVLELVALTCRRLGLDETVVLDFRGAETIGELTDKFTELIASQVAA